MKTLCLLALLPSLLAPVASYSASLVKDISVEARPIAEFYAGGAALGDTYYFTAEDVVHRRELWKTDGTQAGTRLVADMATAVDQYGQAASGAPTQFVRGTSAVYITSGTKILKIDNSMAVPSLVKDFTSTNPQNTQFALVSPSPLGLYVQVRRDNGAPVQEHWLVDNGEPDGTLLASTQPSNPSAGVGSLGSQLYFPAVSDFNIGSELWKTDGTAAGTARVKPAGECLAPDAFCEAHGALYFTATNAAAGRELWKSDGTAVGTTIFKETAAGTASAAPGNIVINGSEVYFTVTSSIQGHQLWKSNGTVAGTLPVSELGYWVNQTAAAGGAIYLSGQYFNNLKVFRSTGTAAGTSSIYSGSWQVAGNPAPMTLFGGNLYFIGWWTGSGYPLMKINGVTGGVSQVTILKDTAALQAGATRLYWGHTESTVNGAWKSDGTPVGTQRVPFPEGTGDSGPEDLKVAHGKLYLHAQETLLAGRALWRTDGTAPGTVFTTSLTSQPSGAKAIAYEVHPTATGILLHASFQRWDGLLWSWGGIWSSDAAGLAFQPVAGEYFTTGKLVPLGADWYFPGKNLYQHLYRLPEDLSAPQPISTDYSAQHITVFGNRFLMKAYLNGQGWCLASWNGTASMPVAVKCFADVVEGNGIAVAGGIAYFNATAPNWTLGSELWKTDGTPDGTVLVKDIYPGDEGSRPADLTVVGDLVYFTATDADGRELWKTDGTTAGTVKVRDILPGPSSSFPNSLIAAGHEVIFAASDGLNGSEIWRSDGTVTGTRMVADVTGDSGSSSPSNLALYNNRLYFAATHPIYGRELFETSLTISLTDWRQQYFGSPLNSGSGADLADPDADGLTNLVEYVLGGLPTQSDSGRIPMPSPRTDQAGVRLTFPRSPMAQGVSCEAQWSADLSAGSWITVPDTGTASAFNFNAPAGFHHRIFVRLIASPGP